MGFLIAAIWVGTEDGSVGGKHTLATPAGTVSAAGLTEEVLVGWLVEQLPNTEEEFIAHIARKKAEREAAETLVVHIF